MASILSLAPEQTITLVTFSLISAYVLWTLHTAISNIYFSPLSKFPGPKLAAATWVYKAWIEGVLNFSWHTHLEKLHEQYGPIVRVGPNELHFSQPQAYLDIYNNSNRWDKEEALYHSFGEDRSSFGYLTYREAKERKDVLNKSFSARALLEAQGIIQGKIDELCSVFGSLSNNKQLVNLSFAFRCMTMDVITAYCFGTSIDAIHSKDFQAPIIIAMDASQPVFKWFKHFTLYKNMIIKCPRPLSRILSPPTSGLVDLQEILETQITKFVNDPKTLDQLPHRQTIYHSLLDPNNYKPPHTIPSTGSLYEEAQALMFAGADTVGQTLMLMTYHLHQPRNSAILSNLQSELQTVYPNPSSPPPSLSTLESLPLLNAVLKESLRLFSGVISGLPRIVPPTGAIIADTPIPPKTVVSIGSTFVHYNAQLFPSPDKFIPDRWLATPNTELDQWLVAFSKGPRSCLGINLAWMELRLAAATVLRRVQFELDHQAPRELTFRDTFLPEFTNRPVKVRVLGVDGV